MTSFADLSKRVILSLYKSKAGHIYVNTSSLAPVTLPKLGMGVHTYSYMYILLKSILLPSLRNCAVKFYDRTLFIEEGP